MAPKKKAPAFYTGQDDLLAYRVKPSDLLTTPLGLTAAVLGVKYAKKDDPESSNLWVEHRCEYQSPIEEQLYEQEYVRCPQGANIWRDVLKLDKIVQEDEEERALVQELNRQYQEQLAAEEAKKSKKKKLPEPAADAAQPPDPAAAATPQLVAPPVS